MSPTVVTVPGSAMTMAKQASHDNVQALRDQITMLEAQLAAKTHHQAWCPITEASISNTELFPTPSSPQLASPSPLPSPPQLASPPARPRLLSGPVACQKRKRAKFEMEPLTPPLTASDPEGTRLLLRAVNVLSTAATALSQVTLLYESDQLAQEGMLRAVETIVRVNEAGGKVIICGVGKSGLVGRKMVATMKSLGLSCSFMHAAEALHGDLGDIRIVRSADH
jgi:hypothetical protein